VVAIGEGFGYSMALTADNFLYAWGDGSTQSGAGESVQLLFENQVPIIRNYTNYVIATNVVQEEQIVRQWQPEFVTNAFPVFHYWTRHSLQVIDYEQDHAAPVWRNPVSLPGQLQGISDEGALLYTLAKNVRTASSTVPEARLSLLAYDGVAAYLVRTLTLSTNSYEEIINAAVLPDGRVVVARDSWKPDGPRRIECWRRDETGALEPAGWLARTTPSRSLVVLDDVAILRTDAGVELVDLANPTNLALLPVSTDLACAWFDIARAAGNRESGLWLPLGESGSVVLWRP
jgi:hypothetical protein